MNENIKFIDLINFLPSSLDDLVENTDKKQFNIFKKFYDMEKNINLLRKGVFPYEYITSPEVLNEKKLPSKDKFYSELTGKGISDKDYKKYNCKTIRDYLEIYLKSDVILLADVFENYRKLCLNENSHLVKLFAADTDSFIIEVETEDFYKDMYEDRNKYYDISDYPKVMKYANEKVSFELKDKDGNKKRLGYFKHEYFGKPLKNL